MHEAVGLLSEVVQKPKFDPIDIQEAQYLMDLQRENMAFESEGLTMEFLHAAAFGADSPLGRPILCPPENYDKIGPSELKAFVDWHYRPTNIVIAACGVLHEDLVRSVEVSFNQLPVRELERNIFCTTPQRLTALMNVRRRVHKECRVTVNCTRKRLPRVGHGMTTLVVLTSSTRSP